jgi:hypothetical protein
MSIEIIINKELNKKPTNDSISTTNTIFRFKFSKNFIEHLLPFAKLHQYTDRHIYKEEWTRWVNNNDELIYNESIRLKNIGYDGDINNKMYKSGRYYFRNKTAKEVQPRRKYISLEHEIITAMDQHICTNFHLPHFKPSTSYEQFCLDSTELLKSESERLLQELQDEIHKDDIQDKFKKTYKNRYYLFQKNHIGRRDTIDLNERNDFCELANNLNANNLNANNLNTNNLNTVNE